MQVISIIRPHSCNSSLVRFAEGARRRLRITAGNAQDLYFPVCFELAVTRGAPPARRTTRHVAEAELRGFMTTVTAPLSRC